jgi:molybdopterin molybdotransferase
MKNFQTRFMVRVEEAGRIILEHRRDFGTETIPFDSCLGRVLAEDIRADRDFPPFNRVTMDGVAITYAALRGGTHSFQIISTQPAGSPPVDIHTEGECVEIMTGAVLPSSVDTVIPYEELEIENGTATVRSEFVTIGQNIHPKGKDKKQDEVLVKANQFITPTTLTVAASVGKTAMIVKSRPRLVIISTGDELIDVQDTPKAYQIRRSNNYTLQAILNQYALGSDMVHLPDEPTIIERELRQYLGQYDVLILSGGVSMGKHDYIPPALDKLQVHKLFHKVQQRPGKPFWFGRHGGGTLVFAFPGNPVSTFMCFYRYFLPWLKASWQVKATPNYAILGEDFQFRPALQYFLQVKLNTNEKGELIAIPVEGNGSGDLVNLLQTDAFMELPLERDYFKKGEVFLIWPFKQIW